MKPRNTWNYETTDTMGPMKPWLHDTIIIWHRHWHILISINSCTVTPSNNRTQSQRSLSVLWSLPSLESRFHIVIATIAEPFSSDRWNRKSSISDSNQLDSAPRSELITYCKTIGKVDSIAAYTCSIMSPICPLNFHVFRLRLPGSNESWGMKMSDNEFETWNLRWLDPVFL